MSADMSPKYLINSEKQLNENYVKVIQPFWQEQLQQGEFSGVGGVMIRYAYVVHPQAIGSVTISSGRIETLIKYKEVVFDLYNNGYSVFIHDHRGQGLSGRMTANPHQGYVEDFGDFVTDFKTFYEQIIEPHSQYKPHMLCHSMGGTIGTLYALTYPDDFAKIALSAPMFGVRPALPDWLGTLLISGNFLLNNCFGSGPGYFMGQGDYQAESFNDNILTHSQSRYQIFIEEYEAQPEVKLGGITTQWLKAAVAAMDAVKQQARQFPIPMLLMQAGADKVVDNLRQDQVAELVPNCQKLQITGASHELLMEVDEYRSRCCEAILQFFAED
jgi:lysophospholipase